MTLNLEFLSSLNPRTTLSAKVAHTHPFVMFRRSLPKTRDLVSNPNYDGHGTLLST